MNILMSFEPFLALFLVVFLINIPLGYIRGRYRKFSLAWLFWIHASIPLIVYLRIHFDFTVLSIKISIALVVWAKNIGRRYYKNKMTVTDHERLAQIPDLRILDYQNDTSDDAKVMVVLMNMGGPKNNQDVPDFLKRVFRDPILIRFPGSRVLQPFFAWMLVTFRAKKTAERYQLIGGGSPIFESTQRQANALKEELKRRRRNLDTIFCFNYSDPLPNQTIEAIKSAGKRYLLPLSLYPQYSSATTGSNVHYLKQAANEIYPQLQFLSLPSYYLHDSYIQALADRIKDEIRAGESLDDFYLIFSAHGLPLYFLLEGDPYPFQISQTVSRILKVLNREHAWVISYQSEVGPMEWLKPTIEGILKALARRGQKNVLVVPVA